MMLKSIDANGGCVMERISTTPSKLEWLGAKACVSARILTFIGSDQVRNETDEKE